MNFNENDVLIRIDVYSEKEPGVVAFTQDDIKRIGSEIEECLMVTPQIGKFEGIQYRFVKDGLTYRMDTYESRIHVGGKYMTQNCFNLCITSD